MKFHSFSKLVRLRTRPSCLGDIWSQAPCERKKGRGKEREGPTKTREGGELQEVMEGKVRGDGERPKEREGEAQEWGTKEERGGRWADGQEERKGMQQREENHGGQEQRRRANE